MSRFSPLLSSFSLIFCILPLIFRYTRLITIIFVLCYGEIVYNFRNHLFKTWLFSCEQTWYFCCLTYFRFSSCYPQSSQVTNIHLLFVKYLTNTFSCWNAERTQIGSLEICTETLLWRLDQVWWLALRMAVMLFPVHCKGIGRIPCVASHVFFPSPIDRHLQVQDACWVCLEKNVLALTSWSFLLCHQFIC